MELKKQKK